MAVAHASTVVGVAVILVGAATVGKRCKGAGGQYGTEQECDELLHGYFLIDARLNSGLALRWSVPGCMMRLIHRLSGHCGEHEVSARWPRDKARHACNE